MTVKKMEVVKVTPKRTEKATAPHNNNCASVLSAFQWKSK